MTTIDKPEPEATANSLYLPELDGLRFFAFLLVFLFHNGVAWLELRGWIGSEATRACRQNGWVGVQLFFILSGFLITTLLLREEERFGRIDLAAFWVRRILRIWPLYYLTVVLTFVLIPTLEGGLLRSQTHLNLSKHFLPFLGFAGNWSMVFWGPVATDAQSVLWSVCVEEQFYLVVPLLIAWFPRRTRMAVVLALMAGSIAARAYLARRGVTQLVIQYNTVAQFDTLLSGVLLALTLGADPRRYAWHNRAWSNLAQLIVLGLAIGIFLRPELAHLTVSKRTWEFVAIWLAGVGLVASIVLLPTPLQWFFAQRRIVRLGRISYGLYMFHEVGFLLRDRFSAMIGWFPFQETLLPIFAMSFTVGLAWLSYQYIERPFLLFKKRWTRVPSRPVE